MTAPTTAATAYDAQITAFIEENKQAIGYMTPPAMRDLLFISDFEKIDPHSTARDKHGYQRPPNESRIPGIARFFKSDDPVARPTPIIVSVRLTDPDEIAAFILMLNDGDIEGIKARFGEAVASLVDGQHRYLGVDRNNVLDPTYCPRVPASFMFGLTFEQEARLFDVINSTPVKVPKALIESTNADLPFGTGYQSDIRAITRMLTLHEDSVWAHAVNLTGARNPDKPVTFEGLRRSTASMFNKEMLARLTAAGMDPNKIARDYWRMVADSCSTAWDNEPALGMDEDGNPIEIPVKYRIKELVGVAALAKLGGAIINSALEHEDFDARMRNLTKRLAHVDWEKPTEGRPTNPWMQSSQAGFSGQADLYNVLHGWVYLGQRPDGI